MRSADVGVFLFVVVFFFTLKEIAPSSPRKLRWKKNSLRMDDLLEKHPYSLSQCNTTPSRVTLILSLVNLCLVTP